MKRAVTAVVVGFVIAGCGSGESGSASGAAEADAPVELGNVSSVTELRDALVDAGYTCEKWTQDNLVELAAESGSCSEDSVLSTYASEADLQAQIETSRGMAELFEEADLEPTPNLVGPNWIFNSPESVAFTDTLGGTVVR